MKNKKIAILLIICLLIVGCGKSTSKSDKVQTNQQIVNNNNNINNKDDNEKQDSKDTEDNTNQKVLIEDYIGKNYLEVKTILEVQGINVIVEKTDMIDDMYTENIIGRQSVSPQIYLEKGETITLYIPDIESVFPDFTDGSYTLSEITKFCDKYGLTLEIEDDTEAPNGTITYQSISSGSKIVHNTTLKIKVGTK